MTWGKLEETKQVENANAVKVIRKGIRMEKLKYSGKDHIKK